MSDIVIYGRGKTGQCLHKMLQKQGKKSVFYDDTQGFDCGGEFNANSLVLLSPGVNPNAKGLVAARKVGARIISELEYCFNFCLGKCVSVTGTNGKTTVCEMINYLLGRHGVKHRLLGNGGVPFSDKVLDVSKDEVVVLESSSFQLLNAAKFSPYISIFTNLAYDHLDYHGNFDNYVEAKTNNFIHQRDGFAVFNGDDDNVVELSSLCGCKKLFYSVKDKSADIYYDGRSVNAVLNNKTYQSDCPSLARYAKHNVSNALAAILTVCLLGVSLQSATEYIADYKFLPHRLQTVATIEDVTFVDDSKATNVHAAISALNSYDCALALILGGSDKGECFDDLFARLKPNVIQVAASGDTAEQIRLCGKKYGVNVDVFDDIAKATKYCFDVLKINGGVVLMSNACASFDKFGSYAERGDYFQKAVRELNRGKTQN